MNDKLDLASLDGVQKNIELLASIFPNCVTESAEGKVVDIDVLKQELNYTIVEGNKERYRLEWPGKREAIITANTPINKTLRPVPKDSVDFDTTENIYIEGDNLEVLKLLQVSYLGKIKMIYIDPPYNTGKDFVYKDNFTKSGEEELLESGQKDEYNQRLVANPETSGRYHSDWLSMMYPRLKLARNLLTEDGVIFISIDDNEVHNLRKFCDDIFGENNFIAQVVWERAYSPVNLKKHFSENHDFLLCYAKSVDLAINNGLKRSEEANSAYSNPDDDPRGLWQSDNFSVGPAIQEKIYEITTPFGRKVLPPKGRCWLLTKDRYEEFLSDNRIWFGAKGEGVPRIKRFLSEVKDSMTPMTIWKYSEVGHSQEAAQSLKKLFDGSSYFDYPKPIELIKRSLELYSQKDSIILDFFSGSATTAHAVMKLNAEDGGNRKYIMVQVPEATDEKREAYKAGYKNICEIGKERIRRAAKKIKEDTNADIDYGFRVFRLDSSNLEGRTALDLVTQVMLNWGLPLSLPITVKNIADKEVYSVAEDALYCCFDQDIDEAFAKEIAKDQPMRIVFRDNSFKDDTAKENVKQLLKQLTPNTEMKVV